MEKCCDKTPEGSVFYNPFNDVVQCHACGTLWVPKPAETKIRTLAEEVSTEAHRRHKQGRGRETG